LASFVPPTGLNFRAVAEKPQPEFFMDYDFAQNSSATIPPNWKANLTEFHRRAFF
jgi:hypothetical protein